MPNAGPIPVAAGPSSYGWGVPRRVAAVACCLALGACSSSSTAPRVPTQIAFLVQPGTEVAGHAMTPGVQVAIEDASGHVVTTATAAVTIVLGPTALSGTLSGVSTVSAVHGVATFPSLSINIVGTGYTLQAMAGAFTPVTSARFNVTPGPAAQLVFTAEPSATVAGRALAPVSVTALDSESNVATGFKGAVTIAFGTNTAGATLSGTLTTVAAAGAATFDNLTVSGAGAGYTLVASSAGLATTSQPFAVFPTGATGIDYNGGPIIYTPKVAALYWSASPVYNGGPQPGTFGAPTADQSLIAYFLQHLGGSPLFNILTTYFDGTDTYVQNVLTYTQYWADSSAPPAAPSDGAVQAEIERGFSNGTLTYDPNTVYAVFTGTGVNLGGEFGTRYCAYHSYFFDGSGRDVKYAVMPYDQDYVGGCSLFATTSPNDDPAADAEVGVLTHELAEATSDEHLDAWYVDSGANSGEEMADLCAWLFGSYSYAANGTRYNQVLGGKDFLVQMLWVNDVTAQGNPVGCQQSWVSTGAAIRRAAPLALRGTPRRALGTDRRHIMRPFSAATATAAHILRRPGG